MTEKQYNECVNLYADNVFRFIVKNLNHTEDARDIVQSTFEKLWMNRSKVEMETSKSYLFTIAYHNMIDHIRKNKKADLVDEYNESSKMVHQNFFQVSEILHKALEKLNETQKSLVLLKDYEGYSYEEIGKITGLNESQVKVYLHRARIILKNYLVSKENVV